MSTFDLSVPKQYSSKCYLSKLYIVIITDDVILFNDVKRSCEPKIVLFMIASSLYALFCCIVGLRALSQGQCNMLKI